MKGSILFILLLGLVAWSAPVMAQPMGEGACTFDPCQPSVPIQPNSSLMTDQNGQLTFQPLPSATLPAYAQCVSNAVAGGSSDKLTVPKLPCTPTTTVLNVTASAPNSSTSPTLQAAGMRALPIVRASGQPLAVGDIPAKGAKFQVTTDGKKWYMLANGPGGGGGGPGGGVPPSRAINTTFPLTGGSNLTSDVNLALTGPSNLASFPSGDIPKGSGSAPLVPSSLVDAGNGVVVGNATGGGQGFGTINAQNILVNGTPVGTATGNVTTVGGTTNSIPQWLNSTGLSTGLPVGTSGGSTVMQSDVGGNSTFPVLTSNGTFSGQVRLTVPTGTAPMVVSSSTVIPNLNASLLNGGTFHNPGTIGDNVAAAGFFTGLSATGAFVNSGASSGTCASGVAFDATNRLVKTACPSGGGISGLTSSQVPIASGPATLGSSLPLSGSTGAVQVVSATSAAKTNGDAVCWQGNNAVDCGGPPGSGAMSGMTPTQVPIAATSSTVTSSQPESGNGGYVATTTASAKTNGNAACWDGNGNTTDCGAPPGTGTLSTITLSPGFTKTPGTQNTGTQTCTTTCTLYNQLTPVAVTASCTLDLGPGGGCQSTSGIDGAAMIIPSAASLTVTLPASANSGTLGRVYNVGSDGVNPFTIATTGGQFIYGCAGTTPGATTSFVIPVNVDVVLIDMGSATGNSWKCSLFGARTQLVSFSWLPGQNLSLAIHGFGVVHTAGAAVITSVACRPDTAVGTSGDTFSFYMATSGQAIDAGSAVATSVSVDGTLYTDVVPSLSNTSVPANYVIGVKAAGANWASSGGSGVCTIGLR